MFELLKTPQGWERAFQIFAKYHIEGEYFHVAAEHDIIYTGPNPDIVNQEDKAELEKLGFRADTDLECFYRRV